MIFCFDVLPVEGFGPQIEFEQIFFRVIISPKIVGVFPQHVGATSMARLGSSKLWVHKWTARLWIVFNVDVVESYGKVVRWILITCEFQQKNKIVGQGKTYDWYLLMDEMLNCEPCLRWGRVDVPSYDDFEIGPKSGWCKIQNVCNFVLFMDHWIRTMLKLEQK